MIFQTGFNVPLSSGVLRAIVFVCYFPPVLVNVVVLSSDVIIKISYVMFVGEVLLHFWAVLSTV